MSNCLSSTVAKITTMVAIDFFEDININSSNGNNIGSRTLYNEFGPHEFRDSKP